MNFLGIVEDDRVDGQLSWFGLFEDIVHFEDDMVELLIHGAGLSLFVEQLQFLFEDRFIIFNVSWFVLLFWDVESVSSILFLFELSGQFAEIESLFLAVCFK